MAATTNQWEYEILLISGSLKDGLNLAGKERWEACGVIGTAKEGVTLIFKRPRLLIEGATDLPPMRSPLIGS